MHDPSLSAALCRAYNRWLTDHCKPYLDRLFGIAMLPMQSVEHAIQEMKFARRELGMRGGFLRPNPYNDRLIHDPVYEPFWSAAEEYDFSIGFHEGGSSGMPTVGIDRFEGRTAKHIISHTMEMMLACLSMIWGDVVERHPKLRCDGVLRSELSIATSADRLIRSSSFRPVVMSSATVSGALFGRSLTTGQVEGGIDQSDVRECLGEVTELASQPRIVLLRQEADIITQCQKALE